MRSSTPIDHPRWPPPGRTSLSCRPPWPKAQRYVLPALVAVAYSLAAGLGGSGLSAGASVPGSEGADALPPSSPAVRKLVNDLCLHVRKAQRPDGGWGEGRSFAEAAFAALQGGTRPSDPANTAFAAMAILAVGNTLDRGDGAPALSKATEFLLRWAEAIPEGQLGRPDLLTGDLVSRNAPPFIRDRFGMEINTFATVQYFARLLPTLADASAGEPLGDLRARIERALDRLVRRMALIQSPGGQWAKWGFSGVDGIRWPFPWPTAIASSGLELSRGAGRTIDEPALGRARAYLAAQLDPATGTMRVTYFGTGTLDGRNIHNPLELRVVAATMRGTALQARVARELVGGGDGAAGQPAAGEISVARLKKVGVRPDVAAALVQAYLVNQRMHQVVDGGRGPPPPPEVSMEHLKGRVTFLCGNAPGRLQSLALFPYWLISESMVLARSPAWPAFRETLAQWVIEYVAFDRARPMFVSEWDSLSQHWSALAILSLTADWEIGGVRDPGAPPANAAAAPRRTFNPLERSLQAELAAIRSQLKASPAAKQKKRGETTR